MIYDVDLDDGRTVTLEADNPPSEQDIYAALQNYQPPAPRPQLQPGDLAGPEARQIPDLATTTRGGPPVKLASFAETIQEPLALAPEIVVHEGITVPGLSETIKKAGEQYVGGLGIRGVSTPTPPEEFTPAKKLVSGAIQGVDELVEGVANFLSSSQGIAETGAAASPIAPAVYLKWANDMVRGGMLNAGEAYDAYKRGDWETFAKQVTGGLGMLLGAGAVTKHGITKIAEPIQAFTGGTPRLEEANAKALAATIPPEKVSIDTGGKVNELRLEGMSLRDAMDLVSGKQSPEQVVEKNYQKMVSPAWNANVSQVQGGHGEAMIAGYNLAIERIKNILGEEPITKAGETYASTIPETTSVPQLEVRPRVGEETPLRQQGEVAGAQQPISGSPQAEVLPAKQPSPLETKKLWDENGNWIGGKISPDDPRWLAFLKSPERQRRMERAAIAASELAKTEQDPEAIVAAQESKISAEQPPALEVVPAPIGKRPQGLYLAPKGGNEFYPVESLVDAQSKYNAMRKTSGLGASELPSAEIVDQDLRTVARISYNGRLWDAAGKEILNVPIETKPAEPLISTPEIKGNVEAPIQETGLPASEFKRINPPQVAQSMALGGKLKLPDGTYGANYVIPGFEEYRTVLLKPKGNKAKRNKVGWRVVEATTGLEIAQPKRHLMEDSPQSALELARKKMSQVGKVKLDEFIQAKQPKPVETPAQATAKVPHPLSGKTETPPISEGPGAASPGDVQGAVVTKVPPLSPTVAPAPSLPPKSQRLIINDLAKGLNLPIRFGRLTTTKYAGYFKKIQNIIGAKRPNDVPVVSHEAGHKLDSTFSLSSDPTIASELDVLGDPATPGSGSSWTPSKSKAYKMGEGVAEFTRYWLTDPTHAKTQAPNTFRAFENALNSNKDLGDTMRQAQSDIQTWKNAEPQARLRSHISIGENPNKTRYTTSQLTRDLVDDLHFVRLAVEHAERGAGSPLPPSRNPYLLARNLRGSYGMADTFIRSGVVDFNSKEVKLGTSLEDALKPVAGRLADFRDWMVAKRAQELHAQGRQTGLVDSDVNFTANKFNADPAFQKAFDDIKQWQDSLLDYAVDSGLIERGSPATATEPATGSFAIREMNQDYVPFHRVFEVGAAEPASQQAIGIGMGLNVGKPGSLKRLQGSQRDIVDPLETMVKNAYTIITASEKAAINRAVAEMANLPDMGRWVERVAAPKANVQFPLSRIRDQLDRAGANTTALPDDLLLNFFRPTRSAPFGENIIRVVRNGENQFYRLNRDLHDTFQALDLEDSGKIIRILSQPAQLLRAGVVLEPSFTVANALRDTFSSAVIGKYGAVPFETTLRGVAALIGNPKLVSEWAASGGRSAVEASYFDRPKLQRFLAERISKDLTPAERALVVTKSPLTALRWLTGLSEEATRIGEYQKAYNSLIKSGMPEGEARRMAAFEARDRQDFAKGGAKTKIVRHLAAFWNAALQANVKLAQSFKQRPVRTTLQGLAYITTAKLLEQAVNWNDPDYWDRQQWERDLFFMIPIGKDASGHTRFLRIPTPFEVGLIFGTLPGRFMQWAKTHRPDAVKGLPSLILKQSVPNPTPSAVQLPFELIPDKGWDFFRGRQIVPESVADLPPESQWTEQTSGLAKSVGKQLGVSPLKVDHAISQTTGGLGKLVSGRQAPGQRFVTAPLAVSNQPVQDFYDTLGKLRQLDQQMKLSGQSQHPQHLQDFEESARKLSVLRKKSREATDETAKANFQNQLFETAKAQMERYRAGQSSGKPRRIKPVTRKK